ncbi:hypothetical protein [Planomonospora sp. ID82291]|uniref:hypothetical protein n=1 Tax=Planomonospora sp. ID82291 TaxID=2738136 RepID=UPI0018C37188|nr:hypothetical protein [Planomonospora sp. ID82291]MBG0815525.1 hypothetical protein [Planomonospora sp. ID82291]
MRLPRLGRRYRLGWPAALIAGGYTAAVAVSGVVAAAGGDGALSGVLFLGAWWGQDAEDLTGWSLLPLLLAGAVQGWALWQILRGPVVGDRTGPSGSSAGPSGSSAGPAGSSAGPAGSSAGPAGSAGSTVRWLRRALYADLGLHLVFHRFTGLSSPWWADIGWGLVEAALVLLFHRVLTGASRGVRLTALAAGTLSAAALTGARVCDALDLRAAGEVFQLGSLNGMSWTVWTVLVLVMQARDGRWGRTTVWVGIADLAMSLVIGPVLLTLRLPGEGFEATGLTGFILVSHTLVPIWLARSAHDLGGPRAEAVPGGDRPVPDRAPLGWWPLPAAAVVLPLLPVLAGLARGVPFWLGPEGPIGGTLTGDLHPRLALLWFHTDLLVGVGGLALLALVAVVRRTRRQVRTAAGVLLLAAAAGAVTAVATVSDPWNEPGHIGEGGGPAFSQVSFGYGGPELYPDWVFASGEGGEAVFLGVPPLWHATACAASALILLLRYGRRPARRSPYRTAAVCAVSAAALCLLPSADLARGPFTTEGDCGRLGPATDGYGRPLVVADGYGRRAEAPPPSDELAFVCAVRAAGRALPSWQDLSDPELVAYGRRLCGVYTRNDPGEIARVRAVSGVDVREFTYVIDEICPSADAVVRAEAAAEEREMREWAAERQRMCDEAPRHRPLIRPASVTRVREPVMTDYGVLEAYEETAESDPFEDGLLDRAQKNGLVAALPGHLMVRIHSDAPTCLTLETYPRRPPVETRGWQHVVEVGYRSPGGRIELGDPMSGPEYPDLALRGRSGHYRIRVHYAWLPWKGEERAGPQRLLIMAYPGRGDNVVVHRKRTGH